MAYNPNATGATDPLKCLGAASESTRWQTFRGRVQVVSLGGNRVLAWDPATGRWSHMAANPNATGTRPPHLT